MANIYGTTGNDNNLTGTDLADYIYGNLGNDIAKGLGGNDRIIGAEGNDTLYGGAGDDEIHGGRGDIQLSGDDSDEIHGGDGNDVIYGEGGSDTLYGDAGDDIIHVGYSDYTVGPAGTEFGSDVADGGTGYDIIEISWWNTGVNGQVVPITLDFGTGNFTVYAAGEAWEKAYNFEALIYRGNDGGDTITGSNNADWYQLGYGADHLKARGGDDFIVDFGGAVFDIDGGAGTDTLKLPYALNVSSGITLKLQDNGVAILGGAISGSILNVERLLFGDDDTHSYPGATAYDDTLGGGALNDALYGGAGKDKLYGNGGNDHLEGGTGDDTLYGGAGNDVLAGGYLDDFNIFTDGNDIIHGEAGNDQLYGGKQGGKLYGEANDDYLEARGLNGTLSHLEGGDGNDRLIGSANGRDELLGGAGNDILSPALDGDNPTTTGDVVDGGSGTDTVRISYAFGFGGRLVVDLAKASENTGGAQYHTFISIENLSASGGDGIVVLRGTSGVNVLTGSVNDLAINFLEGRGGGDTLIGGAQTYDSSQASKGLRGYDIASYSKATSGVHASLANPATFNTGDALGDKYTAIDGLEGSAFNDVLTGDAKNNVIIDGAGNDTLTGGGGTDLVSYANATAGVTVSLAIAGAQNTIGAGTDTLSGFEDLTGSRFNDKLTGTSGNNYLDGGIGADTMTGGAGNDVYLVDNAGDRVIEATGGGTDEIRATATVVLAATSAIENIRLLKEGNINATGSDFANFIDGNVGRNIIHAGGGNDIVWGDGQNTSFGGPGLTGDTIYGEAGNDELHGFSRKDTIDGGTGNDTIYGGANDDTLHGGTGNDTIYGGDGADAMYGDAGIDTVVYTGLDAVIVDLAAGTVTSSGFEGWHDTISGFENVRGGSGADTLTGSGGANALYGGYGVDTLNGGAGNDLLDGGASADKLAGGKDNDTYIVDDAGDKVTEKAGEGTDLVKSSITYTLTANVENLTLTGTDAIGGTGNGLANGINGNSGKNSLSGGDGNDTLNGGLGSDTLTGGAGADTFIFNTKLGSSNIDRVKGFSVADDTFLLDDDIFTKAGAVGHLAAAAFHIGTAAHDLDDRIIYDKTTGKLFYDADGNKSGGVAAIQFALLDIGLTTMKATDFDIIA